jgi:hypothetical protein
MASSSVGRIGDQGSAIKNALTVLVVVEADLRVGLEVRRSVVCVTRRGTHATDRRARRPTERFASTSGK